MSKSIYSKINKRIDVFGEIINEFVFNTEIQESIYAKYGSSILDHLKYINEINQFEKEVAGNDRERFLKNLLDRYEHLKKFLLFADKSFDTKKGIDVYFLMVCIDQIIKHLEKLLLPPDIQAKHQKFESIEATEKILILHYLKIDSLKGYQYHLKPGIFFLSRLLDLNSVSIKKPVLKVSDYTTKKINSASQARNLYPTLERVKLFFEQSELNEISKVIETRIKELKVISGKE